MDEEGNNGGWWNNGGSQGASTFLGMIGGHQAERRNYRNNRNLMGLQNQYQQGLNQQGHDLQMDMWNKTNYGAQMEHIKGAGLNPALMYGMSGGGGTTAGSQGGGSQSMGSSQQGKVMDLSNALIGAQITGLEAKANKDNADANKTGGVDTDLVNANIKGVEQSVVESVQRTSKIKSETDLNKAMKQLKDAEVSRAKSGTQKGDIIGNILEIWGLDPVNNEKDRTFLQGVITVKYGIGLFKDIMQALNSKKGYNVEGDSNTSINNNSFPQASNKEF